MNYHVTDHAGNHQFDIEGFSIMSALENLYNRLCQAHPHSAWRRIGTNQIQSHHNRLKVYVIAHAIAGSSTRKVQPLVCNPLPRTYKPLLMRDREDVSATEIKCQATFVSNSGVTQSCDRRGDRST